MSAAPVINAVGLTKVFRDFWRRARVRAVNDLDLQIEPGEIFGLLGPNGSGKSTTIKMLLGLLHPTRGRVTVFGRPADDVQTKSRIGYLPEESYLYRFLNARETLDYYGTLFQLPRRERRQRIESLLEMVGLRGAARRPVGEYSKGMARRIGLAQALINDPDLLILDEPTSGLDPKGAQQVKDVIVRIGQVFKKTILLSSHMLSDVEEVCGRIVILYGGRVQVAGKMDDVLSLRDRIQFTCERLSPDTVAEIEQLILKREGKRVEVTTPRDRLESLFLRIVHEADVRQAETGGAERTGAIAGFLGQPDSGRAVLETLLGVEKVDALASPAAPAPAPPAARDEAVLRSLTDRPAAAAPPAETAVQPDQSVLSGLLDDADKKDGR